MPEKNLKTICTCRAKLFNLAPTSIKGQVNLNVFNLCKNQLANLTEFGIAKIAKEICRQNWNSDLGRFNVPEKILYSKNPKEVIKYVLKLQAIEISEEVVSDEQLGEKDNKTITRQPMQ